jgi:hypothetical protein
MIGEGTVKYIRAQRIKWWGHFNGMGKNESEGEYGMKSHMNELQRTSKNWMGR